jgi:hypothetical protein
MATVTTDDLDALAQSDRDDAVLALVDDDIVVLSAAEVGAGRVIITRQTLTRELGEDITEVEAVILAGRLTADLNEQSI